MEQEEKFVQGGKLFHQLLLEALKRITQLFG